MASYQGDRDQILRVGCLWRGTEGGNFSGGLGQWIKVYFGSESG